MSVKTYNSTATDKQCVSLLYAASNLSFRNYGVPSEMKKKTDKSDRKPFGVRSGASEIRTYSASPQGREADGACSIMPTPVWHVQSLSLREKKVNKLNENEKDTGL